LKCCGETATELAKRLSPQIAQFELVSLEITTEANNSIVTGTHLFITFELPIDIKINWIVIPRSMLYATFFILFSSPPVTCGELGGIVDEVRSKEGQRTTVRNLSLCTWSWKPLSRNALCELRIFKARNTYISIDQPAITIRSNT
jgi:hypothetical protein